MPRTAAAARHAPEPRGGHLVSTDGKVLPLSSARLTVRAAGGLARVLLEQTFLNPHAEPLHVSYLLPLPHDGAVSGFAFRIGERRVVGEVDRREKARERFEQALVEGKTAALVEQDRTSLFTQELGNVPPGERVVAELTVDQRLLWRADLGGWEWRFPTTVSPRYQGAPGRVKDAAKLDVPVAGGPVAARLHVALTVADTLAEGGRVESPSHALRAGGGKGTLSLEDERGVPLDRDVVVRWPVAAPEPGASLATLLRVGEAARAFGLVTLVPPSLPLGAVSRDLVLLFDVSGSMTGEPLDQSRRVGQALVDTLGPDDSIELVAFSSSPIRWRAEAVKATPAMKAAAHAWLEALAPGGVTEMLGGIREAMRTLREGAQRQVVLFTDGHIGSEEEVVAELLESLPAGSRFHTVGVGSAVNRSLTGPAARAGRGREVIVGLGEDPERAAKLLVAHTSLPVVTEVEVSGSAVKAVAPARPGDLFAGAPSLVALELRPEGGEVVVRGRTADGTFERTLRVPPLASGGGEAALAALFAREAVEDLEAQVAAGEPREALDVAIAKLGLELQVATRLTSWVAISEEPSVDPGLPTRRVVMPHVLPHGTSAEGLGLRAGASTLMMRSMAVRAFAPSPPPRAAARGPGPPDRFIVDKAMLGPSSDLRFSRGLGRDSEDETSAPEGGEAEGARRRATARIVLRDDAKLVVELTVEDELDWAPPARATLEKVDGELRAKVLAAGTTRAGHLAAGTTLRIVLAVRGVAGQELAGLIAIVLGLPRGGTLSARFG